MYSHRSSTGPVDLAFTDRYGGVSAVPFDCSTWPWSATTTPRPRSTQPRAAARRLRARGDARRHEPGARRDARGRAPAARAEQCDALVTDRPDVALWSGSPTACRCCSPTRTPASSAPPTPAARGWSPGVVAGRASRRMRELGADAIERLGRPARVRRLLRGARRDAATRSPTCEPAVAVDHVVGHPGARHRRRRPRPARARRRARSTTSAAARWSPPTSTPTAATGRAPAASPGRGQDEAA